MLFLQPPISTGMFLLVLAVSASAVVFDFLKQSKIVFELPKVVFELPKIGVTFVPGRRIRYGLEIAFIFIILLIMTGNLQDWSADKRIQGGEFTYLINSGVYAADVYHKTGSIPLWNPFMGRGEPLFENPFSFVLNPLMTLPIFWFGAVQGTKVAVLLHIGLMALGGWILGWVLGLKSPSRLLLGLLLGGSGSMAGAIDRGFYQMSLSQAYVPWVYAGLLGTIYRPKQRLMPALFAVATALLTFAGTFWYVLPAMVSCALLVLFHFFRRRWDANQIVISINTPMLRRVAFAGLLLLGIAMARLLPQAVHYQYIDHPYEFLNADPVPFENLLQLYFSSNLLPGLGDGAMYFHYILPLNFAIFLIAARIGMTVLRVRVNSRWCVVIPALIMLVFFTAWGQGGTPFMHWLYDTVPLLHEWRFVGRMLAMGSPWIAVIAAIWFDNLIMALWRFVLPPQAKQRRRLRGSRLLAGMVLLATLVIGGYGALDVVQNWHIRSGMEDNVYAETAPLAYLRAEHPHDFITVDSMSFFGYMPYYETYIRTRFGNPDYHAAPLASTIGTTNAMAFPSPYVLNTFDHRLGDNLRQLGFTEAPIDSTLIGWDYLLVNENEPSHVFLVAEADLAEREEPLDGNDIIPVNTFVHNLDTIEVDLAHYDVGQVLVAQEVAYPGWEVYMNDAPAQIESVGGLIGVRLPQNLANGTPIHIEFAYRPLWFYVGALITFVSVLFFAIYVLRLDRVLQHVRKAIVSRHSRPAADAQPEQMSGAQPEFVPVLPPQAQFAPVVTQKMPAARQLPVYLVVFLLVYAAGFISYFLLRTRTVKNPKGVVK